jgi:translocator protein
MMNQRQTPVVVPSGRLTSLLLLFGVTALTAAVGAIASVNARDFYDMLAKPTWAPSGRVFGPVWTLLYLLMAFAAWLVYQKDRSSATKGPQGLYLAQLALNALWSCLFFGWRLGGWAVLEITVLWFILLLTLVSFWRMRAAAGMLLLPYLMWVTFAAALTVSIWRLNPGVL